MTCCPGTEDGHHVWSERHRLVVVFPCGWWEREAGAGDDPGPASAEFSDGWSGGFWGHLPGEPATARGSTHDGGTTSILSLNAPASRQGAVTL